MCHGVSNKVEIVVDTLEHVGYTDRALVEADTEDTHYRALVNQWSSAVALKSHIL